MSYQVLARKWRPQRFSEVVGQKHVLSALENGLREDRLHHAYLFSGTRGVGKTSIARLFAKGLNCEKGITAEPCGVCANCKAIEEGRFIDLIEIDAASRTKVEDTRELLDNVQYKPTVGRFKVYLIDEVHMLSRSSFNALLKTLEEPPEYVKFFLATTDPQKLPITILSRCMQFHLRALNQTQIRDHLEFILKQEQIPYELAALEKLAKAAQGSIRDSLSLTDQAIAVSNGNITAAIVSQMLGLIDDHQSVALVQALALSDGEKAMSVIQSVADKGGDWQQLLSDVAEVLHKIAMLQLLSHRQESQSHSDEDLLHFLSRQLPPEDVQFFYQLMLSGKKELPFAPDQRMGVEMTVLRALAFHPKNADKILNPTVSQPHSAPAVSVQSTQQSKSHSTAQITQLRERLTQNQQPAVREPVSSLSQAVSLAENSANVEPKTVATPVENSAGHYQPNDNSALSSPLNVATMALNALNKLDAKAPQKSLDEKKKDKPLTLSVSSSTEKTSENTQKKLARSEQLNSVQQATMDTISDEDYRWTWLNPELENQQEEVPKPSDIKQAILQERDPKLVNKMIELANQTDQWSRIISRLNLSGLARQVVLNSYLENQQGNELQLVLKPSVVHLQSADILENLTKALAEQGLTYQIKVGESDSYKTPLELRRQIFEDLTQEAKQALIADERLKRLRTAFDAEIDESTVRAVVENNK